MTTHRNGFEGQPDGADITTLNTPLSGDPLTVTKNGTGTAKYTSVHTGSGVRAALLTPQPGFTVYLDDTGYADPINSRAWTFYYPGPPSVAQTIGQFRTSAGQAANVTVLTSGKVQLQNTGGSNVGSSVNALVPGHVYRVEAQCLSDAAAGKLRAQWFIDNAGTAVESLTATGDGLSLNTRGGAITLFRMGFPGTTNGWTSMTIDDVQGQDGAMVSFGPFPANLPPIANAGPDQTNVEPFATVNLDGSASVDKGGGFLVGWAWTQVAGTPVALINANTATPSFVAPATVNGDTLVFRLTVTDDGGATTTDDVSVAVLPHTVWLLSAPIAPLQISRL